VTIHVWQCRSPTTTTPLTDQNQLASWELLSPQKIQWSKKTS
jgi:hypothetical protein